MLLCWYMGKKIVSNDILLHELSCLVAEGKQVILLTKGNSMLPFITGGRDSVELAALSSSVKKGDIVLAYISNPNRYVLHRVIKIKGNNITLMGDGNIKGCEHCTTNDIKAIVTKIIKPKKEIKPHTKPHATYAKLWYHLRPLRRYLLALRRLLFSLSS